MTVTYIGSLSIFKINMLQLLLGKILNAKYKKINVKIYQSSTYRQNGKVVDVTVFTHLIACFVVIGF